MSNEAKGPYYTVKLWNENARQHFWRVCGLKGVAMMETFSESEALNCRNVANGTHASALTSQAARVRELERENEALHAMFDKVATADKRTPLAMNDATIITIGQEDWIVPNQIAAEFRRLSTLTPKEPQQ